MKRSKKTVLILLLFSLFTPFLFAQAEDYCIWKEKQGSGRVVDYCNPDTDKDNPYWVIDNTSTSCDKAKKKTGEICCCQIKDMPGQCVIKKTCSAGSTCIDGLCESDTVKIYGDSEKEQTTALFSMPDFQISIPGLSKLATITCVSGETCEIPWLGQYVKGLYNYMISIAGIIAAIVLMAGGVVWLISAGDASKITQAKELILGSIIGLIILAGSYLILYQINPNLVNLQSVLVKSLTRVELDAKLADTRSGSTALAYKLQACATDELLATGVDFYATGYFKYPWQENHDIRYLCMMSMQGTCPNGMQNNYTCKEKGKYIFPDYEDYPACNDFTKAQYDSNYFSQDGLIVGQTIAGPDCPNLKKGDKVCFKGKTYTITDSGGGIKGRRIDILSASEVDAINNSGVGKLTKGACK